VGVGSLGRALLAYSGFARYGLVIVAAFDADPKKVGKTLSGCSVKPMKALKPLIQKRDIGLAILTVSDDVVTGEATSSTERETTLDDMVTIALEALLIDGS